MKISVQNDLTDIKIFLNNRGYEVYNLSDGINSEVYLYSDKSMGFYNLYNNINAIDNGSFILNVDGKSISEIMYCINTRTYSSLF